MQVKRLGLVVLLVAACGGLGRQAPECAQWVACSDALPNAIKGSMDAAFGPDGNCWLNKAEQAQLCVAQCKNALAAQSAMTNPPAECR